MDDLYKELQEALESGNKDLFEDVQRRILLAGRDEKIDFDMISNIKGKMLYKTMVKSLKEDNNFDYLDYEKMICSLMTHCIIESQIKGRDINDYPMRDLYILLGDFINEDEGAVRECKKFIQTQYGRFL